jgi:hypothetical protein
MSATSVGRQHRWVEPDVRAARGCACVDTGEARCEGKQGGRGSSLGQRAPQRPGHPPTTILGYPDLTVGGRRFQTKEQHHEQSNIHYTLAEHSNQDGELVESQPLLCV